MMRRWFRYLRPAYWQARKMRHLLKRMARNPLWTVMRVDVEAPE